jgi:hypothetical protein
MENYSDQAGIVQKGCDIRLKKVIKLSGLIYAPYF